MKSLSRTFNVFGELSHLGRMLFTDGMSFIFLCARSLAALAVDNPFLRKYLAFYQERQVRPRRFDNLSTWILVLLSYGFAWKEALVNNSSKTLTGCPGAGFLLLWRWKSRPGWSPPPNKSASDQATGFLDPTRTPSPHRGAGPPQQGEQGVLPNYGITLKPTDQGVG